MGIRSLRDVPVGSSIFVDTNVLIYHLLEDELYGVSCRDFLKQVESGSVVAFTSPIVASETLFIYLRAWLIKNKKIAPKRVLRYLKHHRAVVKEVDFHMPLALLALIRILPLNNQLLPADSIDAALIRRHHLAALATRDDDFDLVESLDVYKP